MTAAEVMASLGRSVNRLEQHYRQQQQRTGRPLLNLILVNGQHTGPDSADSTTSIPASITATIISALLRSTAIAMTRTCGNVNHHHLSSYSASTTPAIPCPNVFSGSDKDLDKPGVEPEWNSDSKDKRVAGKELDGTDDFAWKKNSKQEKDTATFPRNKNKDIEKHTNDDTHSNEDEGIYKSEQEFGKFSSGFDAEGEEDSWREYRNMMYYSNNYPPPSIGGGGGGESSRPNSRRSSFFSPSSSLPTQATPSTTANASDSIEEDKETGYGLTEEEDLPFWTHFYSLDALQSTLCQRLSHTTYPGTRPPHHQHQHHPQCSQSSLRQKQFTHAGRRVGQQPRIVTRRVYRHGTIVNPHVQYETLHLGFIILNFNLHSFTFHGLRLRLSFVIVLVSLIFDFTIKRNAY
ncbi:hypothetical protein BGX33_010377 [Mortierella sp. NVP41]|nr:hypothetical protein BGX33_010377 [Mortierella sp. NVP41]